MLVKAVGDKVDYYGYLGDGSVEPLGIFTDANVNSKTSIGTPTDWDDFIDALYEVEVDSFAGELPMSLVWHPEQKNTMSKLLVNSEANHYAEPPQAIRELRKLLTTQIGTSRALIGDLSQILVGVRLGQVEIEVSNTGDGDAWKQDQIEFKARWRGDVGIKQPTWLCAMTGITNT
jgi:hypothetical protein